MRTCLVKKSYDGTRCYSLLWCSGRINVAKPSFSKLTWNTLNVISEKKKKKKSSSGFHGQIYKREEKCNTWKVLLFHIIFREKIANLQVDERNQRKKHGEKKPENHSLKQL